MPICMICAWLHGQRRYLFRILCATSYFASGHLTIPPAKTSLHTTSQTLQINATIPSEFRKILLSRFFPSKEVTVCMCKQKIHAGADIWSHRRRFGRFDHLGSVMSNHRDDGYKTSKWRGHPIYRQEVTRQLKTHKNIISNIILFIKYIKKLLVGAWRFSGLSALVTSCRPT